MSRLVSAASVIVDQLDFYVSPGSINRATGVALASISLKVFHQNSVMPWDLLDGTLVQDSSVVAGHVYYNEVSTEPGYYVVRFFFDRIGFWRLIFRNPSLNTEIIKEYDVVAADALKPNSGGLTASFVKSC